MRNSIMPRRAHGAGVVEGEHDFKVVPRFIGAGGDGDGAGAAEHHRKQQIDIRARGPGGADVVDARVDDDLGHQVAEHLVVGDVGEQELLEHVLARLVLVMDARCGQNRCVDGILKLGVGPVH